jgi:hypothetical protein
MTNLVAPARLLMSLMAPNVLRLGSGIAAEWIRTDARRIGTRAFTTPRDPGVETMGHRSRIGVHVLWAMLFFSATVRPVFGQSSVTAASPPALAIVHAQQEPGAAGPGDLGFRFQGYLRSGLGGDGDGNAQQPFQAPLAGAK